MTPNELLGVFFFIVLAVMWWMTRPPKREVTSRV